MKYFFFLKTKMNLDKRTTLCVLLFFLTFGVWAQTVPLRVLFIPLDDRPPCLQFPEKMAQIAQVELVSPPRALLGKFTQPGDSQGIGQWIDAQDLSQFDAAIVSLDMLLYGGLVASRVFDTQLPDVKRRLQILHNIRKKAPQLPIYGSSVIMRLAPTADGKNEAYREKLARWAEFSPDTTQAERVQKWAQEIPAEALQRYQQARTRNAQVNRWSLDLAQKNFFQYLILSQDDAHPRGVHVREREALVRQVQAQQLTDRVAIQPGADEVSMLLLARLLADKHRFQPRIRVVFSSEKMADQAMPFEDRPLRQTVSAHIRATGAQEVTDTTHADLFFYVFTSRSDTAATRRFVQQLHRSTQQGRQIILADIDPKGDVQGGDVTFTENLRQLGAFSRLAGYACWNTAGNAIGTALPHGLLWALVQQKHRAGAPKAQQWFMLNRLLDDYAFHSLVRPKAQRLIREKGWNSFRLSDAQAEEIRFFCEKELQSLAPTYLEAVVGPTAGSVPKLSFALPWNRTFEAEIDCPIAAK
jgi:Protein of unknown function (DUF4127)